MVTKSADGYPALRFAQTVRFVGFLGNLWEFRAGTVLIGDRTRYSDGQMLYCGPMSVLDLAAEIHTVCTFKRGNKLVISGAISSDKVASIEAERDIPPGAIEEVRSR